MLTVEQIDHFEPGSPPRISLRSPRRLVKSSGLDQVVASAGERHHLDPDLIRSVIHAESGFNVRAVSPKGAQAADATDAGNGLRHGSGECL